MSFVDPGSFFTPPAFGSWNPPPGDLFPQVGAGGVAPTPSGLPGTNFGVAPSTMPPVAATNPVALPTSAGGIPAASGGVTAPSPAAAGGNWWNNINTSKLTPQFLQTLQKMFGPKQQQQQQQLPQIQMAQPVGPRPSPMPNGNMTGQSGLLTPFLAGYGGGGAGNIGY